MPDERDVAQAKKAIEQNEKEGTIAEDIGEHPEHAPQAGRKRRRNTLIKMRLTKAAI
ncbi:MAG: hypothetical protein WKF71_20530 [Pyrinomonadaceae bacterium]